MNFHEFPLNNCQFSLLQKINKKKRYIQGNSIFQAINHSGGRVWVFPKIGVFPPKSSILIGVCMILTIHFWGVFPYFWKHPYESDPISETTFSAGPNALEVWAAAEAAKRGRSPRPRRRPKAPGGVGSRFWKMIT